MSNQQSNGNGAPIKRSRNWSVSDYGEYAPKDDTKFSQSSNAEFWQNNRDPDPRNRTSEFQNEPTYGSHQQARFAPPGSTYLGNRYDPNHNKNKKVAANANKVQHPELIPKKSTETIDYKARLNSTKKWAKIDPTSFFKLAEINPDDGWRQFTDPIMVFTAQRFLTLASKSLKNDENQSKNRGPSSALTDAEFEDKLNQASKYLRP